MIINDTCNTVTVYDYYKSIDSNDKKYLIKGYNKKYIYKGLTLDIDNDTNLLLEKAFEKVSFEFQCMSVDKSDIKKKKAEIEIISLSYKHNIVESVVNIYNETLFLGVFDLLTEIKVPFNKENDINKEIKKLITKCKHFKNDIKIRKINYAREFKTNEDAEDVKSDLVKQVSLRALHVSLNLEMKTTIDIEKTSLFNWVNLNELNEAKVAMIKKISNGKS